MGKKYYYEVIREYKIEFFNEKLIVPIGTIFTENAITSEDIMNAIEKSIAEGKHKFIRNRKGFVSDKIIIDISDFIVCEYEGRVFREKTGGTIPIKYAEWVLIENPHIFKKTNID